MILHGALCVDADPSPFGVVVWEMDDRDGSGTIKTEQLQTEATGSSCPDLGRPASFSSVGRRPSVGEHQPGGHPISPAASSTASWTETPAAATAPLASFSAFARSTFRAAWFQSIVANQYQNVAMLPEFLLARGYYGVSNADELNDSVLVPDAAAALFVGRRSPSIGCCITLEANLASMQPPPLICIGPEQP